MTRREFNGILAAAAAGLMGGPGIARAAPQDGGDAPPAHACAGRNACKGKGNCRAGDNGCRGKK